MRSSRPFILVAAVAAAVAATVRRRKTQSDTEALWREATADASQQ